MRTLRSLVVIALAAVTLVVTSASALPGNAPVIERGKRAVAANPVRAIVPTVTVLGDSITWDACDAFTQQVPSWVNVKTNGCLGWPGASSDEMQAYVENQGFRSAWHDYLPYDTFNVKATVAASDVLVIALGTNDAMRDQVKYNPARWPGVDTHPVPSGHVPVDNGYFDQKIDYFMRLANGKPVYWYDLGIKTSNASLLHYFNRRNEQLYAATKRWPNLHMLPWGGVVGARPELMRDPTHCTPAGYAARWQLLKDAMGR